MRSLESYYDGALAESGPALRLLMRAGVAIVGTGITLLFRARYLGREVFDRIPEGKAAIIAGNHSSYTDPMFVFKAIWPRRVRFMAKAQLFEHKVLRRILAYFGVFPVHQDARGRQAIKRSVACLKRGEYVGIFPEGTRVKQRDKTDVPYNEGVALVAKMADALIIPVGIEGTIDISPHGSKWLHYPRVTLRFGDPVDYRDFEALGFERQELFDVVTDEVMRRVRALSDGIEPEPAPLERYAERAERAQAASLERAARKAAKKAEKAAAKAAVKAAAKAADKEVAEKLEAEEAAEKEAEEAAEKEAEQEAEETATENTADGEQRP